MMRDEIKEKFFVGAQPLLSFVQARYKQKDNNEMLPILS
jgi:hypothetical protein